ncbi:hypothetical protein [Acetobacter sp. AN02]|nr:hypothetical protein [Acetobacter sp. AN02]
MTAGWIFPAYGFPARVIATGHLLIASVLSLLIVRDCVRVKNK